jgi:hypothetical protein
MAGYNCWTKHGERGVMMEDGEEENDGRRFVKQPVLKVVISTG